MNEDSLSVILAWTNAHWYTVVSQSTTTLCNI